MTDWAHPVLSDGYSDVLTVYLVGRDVDAITLCYSDPTNIPEHALKYHRASNKFQERNAGVWTDLLLSLAGGGTGAATASDARTNLGLGTLAIQNANAVAITGGSISGVTVDAAVITSGTLPLARGGTGASLTIGAAGTFLRSNGSVLQFSNDGSSLTNLQIAAGSIMMFGGAVLPTGWLQCNGVAVSRATYAALFAVIGTTYGVGDGSTTFNLPNLKARFPIGNGDSSPFNVLGNSGDTTTHSHTISLTSGSASVGNTAPTGAGQSVTPASHTHLVAGSTNAGNHVPPYLVVNFIIKT
jgi:microcystin-dependent protein